MRRFSTVLFSRMIYILVCAWSTWKYQSELICKSTIMKHWSGTSGKACSSWKHAWHDPQTNWAVSRSLVYTLGVDTISEEQGAIRVFQWLSTFLHYCADFQEHSKIVSEMAEYHRIQIFHFWFCCTWPVCLSAWSRFCRCHETRTCVKGPDIGMRAETEIFCQAADEMWETHSNQVPLSKKKD